MSLLVLYCVSACPLLCTWLSFTVYLFVLYCVPACALLSAYLSFTVCLLVLYCEPGCPLLCAVYLLVLYCVPAILSCICLSFTVIVLYCVPVCPVLCVLYCVAPVFHCVAACPSLLPACRVPVGRGMGERGGPAMDVADQPLELHGAGLPYAGHAPPGHGRLWGGTGGVSHCRGARRGSKQ